MPNEEDIPLVGQAFAEKLMAGFSSPENLPNQTATEARGMAHLNAKNLAIARDEVIVPGTSLTLGAAERLENASQNLVAVANLYANETVITRPTPGSQNEEGEIAPRIPVELQVALGKINAILAGPGPLALDRRPNSVEIVGDPVLHERALMEAKAKEMARAGLAPAIGQAADEFDSLQAANSQAILESFEEGKAQGYQAGVEHARADIEQVKRDVWDAGHNIGDEEGWKRGYASGLRVYQRMSLSELILSWWRSRAWRREQLEFEKHAKGAVGGIDKTTLSWWRNNSR